MCVCQGCQQHQEDRLEKDDDASQSCSSRGEVWLIIDSIGDGIHDDLLSNEWYAKVNSHFGINITTMLWFIHWIVEVYDLVSHQFDWQTAFA